MYMYIYLINITKKVSRLKTILIFFKSITCAFVGE